MKHSFQTEVQHFSDSPIWAHHLVVPISIAEKLNKPDRRVMVEINKKETFHAALMHDGSGGYFINLNKQLMKTHGISRGDKVEVVLEKDTSKYGIYTPDFFEEFCEQDPEGSTIFHNLSMGNQRNLLRLIGKPKSENKQVEKALIIFEYLKNTDGEIDYKGLNAAFKSSRFKM